MQIYEIAKTKDIEYSSIIFSTDCSNPIDDLTNIEKDLRHEGYIGKVIFDLLLVNGNCNNRFIEAFFNGQKFDRQSFKNHNLISQELKAIITDFYYINSGIVENSRLSKPIKFLIKRKKLPFN
ncbi:type II toxin-antitoxin system RnlB family antitoxin [Romboutsia sp. 1001713B170131_170501_G6]|uniref:type II toxin-antitoxin system RnlB family antitoxin n=1 Tax=Romboutsia sp. 1001713B170131_170501_G6 TaxID=2787108 RepID=UPI0018AC770E|nr:type II toxin-antitoxin system RnlB family antitoxin [Romboutsia sp. 1001713B170131_170501_G6]